MRIRKNGNLCHILLSNGTSVPLSAFQSHVCQLNQSPWDVIPFPTEFEGVGSFGRNDSPADPAGVVESVVDSQDKSLPKLEEGNVQKKANVKDGDREHENGIEFDKGEEKTSHCQKTDGKGWQCKNQAKDGQSFCQHHLSLLRSYNSGSTSKKAAAAAVAGTRRLRARAAKKAAISSNPNEFYYYSGFGPLWGRKRGDRNGEVTNNEPKILENSMITETAATAATNMSPTRDSMRGNTPSSSSQKEFDYVVDDDEEDDSNGDSGKKRMRKLVKARSLKSLM